MKEKKIPVEIPEFKGKIGSPIIEQKDAKLSFHRRVPIIIAGSFTDTEIKLYEADFFIKFIEENSFHHALVLYGLSAFLTASRAITLFLQTECSKKEGFEEWYEAKRKILEENEFAKFLLETRNTSAHKMYANITLTHEKKARLNKRRMVFEVPNKIYIGFEFEKYEFKPGLAICKDYLKLLKEIIREAKERGFLSVDRNHGHKVRFMISGLNKL